MEEELSLKDSEEYDTCSDDEEENSHERLDENGK